FLRSPDDNRVVWPTPSLEQDVIYIGTTDTDYAGSVDDVHPEPSDIRYLLNVANHTIPGAHLTEQHVVGSWAGLRPLVAPPPGVSESNTSREHEISEGPTGMLTISGGKLTTARVMARQLVDRVEKALAHRSTYRAGAMPLPGADPGQIHEVRVRAETAGVPPDLVGRWLHKYGANAAGILDRYLAGPANTEVLGARGLTRAELAYCVAEEMVLTLADLMIRRTSTFFWEADGGLSTVQVVADALEELVPWEPGRKEAEVEQYQRLVRQHRPAAAAE
ncbi:MAG TPA: FAD-dependent oxidoreductase, partial [Propionicimonas sp.]